MVQCSDGSLYTGIATDLGRRIRQHNGEITGGAKYTATRQPVSLVYQEQYIDRSQASQREAEIKKMTRAQKTTLISLVGDLS